MLHFNGGAMMDAARGYKKHMSRGGKMMVTLAGAMSTAELGRTLSIMIREGKIDIISCTGANLEEGIMFLVAASKYVRVPNYRYHTKDDEQALLERHLNRVTDTCIPEEEAFRVLQHHLEPIWDDILASGEPMFPHEIFYRLLKSGVLEESYEDDPKNCWMLAAAEKNLAMVVPGWEDSTLGNIFSAYCVRKGCRPHQIVKGGIEYMMFLQDWYQKNSEGEGLGFFQVGGGIAGDFPICVVPMLHQDMNIPVPCWSYFCQISDSITSYGGYSGATPNEKITWGKLKVDTPMFVVESDATIVAPLIFAYILGM
jgi:deoxyhypusine synthase